MERGVLPEKPENNAILFTKEQFNAGLRFPVPSLLKEFLHFTQIPPVYVHPNMIRVLMGCSILSMLFNLDLSLLEVLFVYSIKKVKSNIFSFVASLPSLQLVTNLPDSNKKAAKGQVLVKGVWAGLSEHPDRPFVPNQSLKIPDQDKRGKLVEWVEKASFDRLNKLFEITSAERRCELLLSAQNLRLIAQQPQAYVLNILPRRLPEEVCPGNARPFSTIGERKDKKASAEGSGWETDCVLSACWALVAPDVRMALLAEEAASINQPGSAHPDEVADLPPVTPPTGEMGADSQELPVHEPSPRPLVPVKGPTRRSCVWFRFWLRLRFQFWLRLRFHPERPSRLRMLKVWFRRRNHSPMPPWEGPFDDATFIPANPFSYAEMEEKLKQIPSVADAGVPSALMFETVETLVSGLRGMVLQRNLLSDLLETAEYTKSFVSQRKNDEEKLRLRVEQAEASSSTAREENKVLREENEVLREKNEVLREEVAEVKSREDSMEVRLFEAEEEMALLRREVRHLRTEVSIERRQREELQLRLSTQKEELEGEFAAERGELEAEYQKQVDEMYLFGYRCCMKKHGIKRDVPSIPSG
ncbi:uncharacterized protein LOC117921158 [Vitis riparia]|uniref:uncharacterized protein LOC117921158 n=1 Tax=Vitis riparia TaxID=96939 RepID=UPI00155B3D8B|nr:uncharacterized protein LOC117921158 [Vitis riparia]